MYLLFAYCTFVKGKVLRALFYCWFNHLILLKDTKTLHNIDTHHIPVWKDLILFFPDKYILMKF